MVVELVFFQAAAPIATGVAAGQVEVGVTGLTAALYNIVLGVERLWIVADKGREWPGYPLTAIVDGGRPPGPPSRRDPVRVLTWGGDLLPWQIAAIFYSRRFAADRGRALAFMKGYAQVLARRDGRPTAGPPCATARYTGARPEIIRLGFPYQDRDGRLMVEDIEKQTQSFAEAAVAALGR